MDTNCTTIDEVVFPSGYVFTDDRPTTLGTIFHLSDGVRAHAPVKKSNDLRLLSSNALSNWVVTLPSEYSTQQTALQQGQAISRWSILGFRAVCEFCELRQGYDIAAMQQIFNLVQSEFRSYKIDYELIADSEIHAELILRVDAHELPMEKLIEKELRVFEVISKSITLSNANKYNIISIA
ncbi:hypothetical protein F3J24_17300 [Comamonas sp. Tr-654]|uniref:hypothetical protein n=1 Tax=Comamonas sp. Tr-654 TaxID=2608341 RepID=UPI001421D88B|nr:hypothetical protein [Comamonas sp. Tr-654]NIF85271.1 hypothetical protein [Comamonas sp. Tr-654]